MASLAGTVFYLDASALVKRYVTEPGSARVMALCQPSMGNTITTARISQAEAAAAFAGKYRNGELTRADYAKILQDLAHDFAHQYLLIEIDQTLVDLAVNLTVRHKLRGYDAVQLAAALILNDLLIQAQFPPAVLVVADNNLLSAAQNEGLLTENPTL